MKPSTLMKPIHFALLLETPEGGMEHVFIGIQFPEGMSKEEAVERAKKLVPCQVGAWEEEQSDDGWMTGNLECGSGFYEENENGGEYGPDDGGVPVSWEKP